MIVDDDFWKSMAGTGFTLEHEALQYLKVNNLSIEGKPEGLTVNTHVCRGNYHSCYATKGAYDAVAPYLFAARMPTPSILNTTMSVRVASSLCGMWLKARRWFLV